MSENQFEALSQVRAALVAILREYLAVLALPQFQTDTVLTKALALHKRHEGELLNRQSALGYSTDGDSIEMVMQEGDGMLIKKPSDLLMEKERELVTTYEEALTGWHAENDGETYALLKTQLQQLQFGLGV